MYVDADGHILEPPRGLVDFAPSAYRERVLHIETGGDGQEWLVWNRRRVLANPYAVAGTAGLPEQTRLRATRGELRYSTIRPAAFEPEGYLRDMDAEGIAASVLYPSLLLNLASDPDVEFAEVQASAYNRYISEFTSRIPGRLFAAAILPQRDIEASVAEIARVRKLPGIVAVMLRPNPLVDGRPFSHELYRPLWRAACDAGLAVALHPSAGTGVNGVAEAMHLTRLGTSEQPLDDHNLVTHSADNAFFPSSVAQMDVMISMAFFIAGGVCQRFPDLRVAFLEANGGWVVPWLERLDSKARTYPWDLPELRAEPSDYFRRQCWISFDPDESALAFTAGSPMCGSSRMVWASDYPHQDAMFPGVTRELEERLRELDPGAREQVRSASAIELYQLEVACR